MTDMENSTFYGYFREKSTRKPCINSILSFWNPLYAAQYAFYTDPTSLSLVEASEAAQSEAAAAAFW